MCQALGTPPACLNLQNKQVFPWSSVRLRGGKVGFGDVRWPEIVGQSRALSPEGFVPEPELGLRRVVILFWRQDCVFPKDRVADWQAGSSIWPTDVFCLAHSVFLKIRKFYIIIYISGSAGKPGRSSNSERQRGDAGLLRPLRLLGPSQISSPSAVQCSVSPSQCWHRARSILGYWGLSHVL